MMQIVYFSRKEQFFEKLRSYSGKKLFIAPSPAKADHLRGQVNGADVQDVLTIARFTSDLIESLWSEGERPSVKRKAELLLIFGILRNSHFPHLGFEQFLQSYNLFSDLRSFTLNQEALTSILEEQPREISQAVCMLWKLLEITGYLDEHAAYHRIAEALRSAEEVEGLKKTYIFWGFQHLNGQQVDLLKALAIRYDVIIPFPLSLKDKVKKSDWLSWVQESKVREDILPELPSAPQAQWHIVNSREISQSLTTLIKDATHVVMGVNKLTGTHINLLPATSVSFKVPHELIRSEILEIADALMGELNSIDDISDLAAWIVAYRQQILSNPEKRKAPFKKLKAIQLFENALGEIQNMTDAQPPMDKFLVKLMMEVVLLNQPRTSLVPLLENDPLYELKDLSSIEDIPHGAKVILCVDERFDDPVSLSQGHPELIQKALSSLGPIKRPELELHFKKWELEDLLSRTQVTVLMPAGVLKHSLIWKRLFSSIQLTEDAPLVKKAAIDITDYFARLSKKTYLGNFSASRFQSYLDCPRKFYYSYVERISPSLALENDIDPLTAGTIVHEILELFHKRKLTESELPSLTKEVFQKVISENNLELPRDVYLQRSLVFNQRAQNGISFLKNLSESCGENISWKMEESFSWDEDYKLAGKIDCLGISSKFIFLLDFKSSKAAASTNTEIEAMESLQLWVYALAAMKMDEVKNKTLVFGFIILDDPSESNLLTTDDDLVKLLKSAGLCKPKLMGTDMDEALKLAEEKLAQLSLAIRADRQFASKPRKASSCDFCDLNLVCVKGGVSDV